MYLYFIGLLLLLILAYIFITYNIFINLRNNVKEAFSTMDVYLKKRADLIPNIVETVKGYAKHEKATLTEIVELRNKNYGDMSIDEKINHNEKITNAIGKLFAIAEDYPELKANENFLDLSEQLTDVEDDIANSRKYYNAVVRILNNKVEMIPSNVVALIFRIKTMKMFEATNTERENIKVEL